MRNIRSEHDDLHKALTKGSISITRDFEYVIIEYRPFQEEIETSALSNEEQYFALSHSYKLMCFHNNIIDGTEYFGEYSVKCDMVCIYPLIITSGNNYLKNKYNKIEQIRLEGFSFRYPNTSEDLLNFLNILPAGFSRNLLFGIGLLQRYKVIIKTIEEIQNVRMLTISRVCKTEFREKEGDYCINFQDFEHLRRGINRIEDLQKKEGAKQKDTFTFNTLLHKLDPSIYKRKDYKYRYDIAFKSISDIETSRKYEIYSKHKNEIFKIKNDIELCSLKFLIEKYEEKLKKQLGEKHWQALFNENPFILSMIFGCPIIKVQDQASVGGLKFSGAGNKIADFLSKNLLTNNTAIIEIKTPQEKLIGREYRDNVYSPSVALSGSLNQALDQKYNLQKDIDSLARKSRIRDIETYAVHCALVIGTMPDDLEKQKSFEIFRKNSRDVEIITFDELLEKLKLLHDLLSTNEVE